MEPADGGELGRLARLCKGLLDFRRDRGGGRCAAAEPRSRPQSGTWGRTRGRVVRCRPRTPLPGWSTPTTTAPLSTTGAPPPRPPPRPTTSRPCAGRGGAGASGPQVAARGAVHRGTSLAPGARSPGGRRATAPGGPVPAGTGPGRRGRACRRAGSTRRPRARPGPPTGGGVPSPGLTPPSRDSAGRVVAPALDDRRVGIRVPRFRPGPVKELQVAAARG